jgi:Fe-S-cluster containining protein
MFEIKPEWPQAVRERLQNVDDTVRANAATANADMQRRAKKIGFGLEQLGKLAKSGSKHRVRGMALLRDIAMVWGSSVAKGAACRQGCNHCCHKPVPISAVEAKVIGKAIKRHPASIQDSTVQADGTRLQGDVEKASGACTFLLANGDCAIYAHRPVLCRTRFNLDQDALLCETVDGQTFPVPEANAAPIHTVYQQLSADSSMADLREFFPHGLSHKA